MSKRAIILAGGKGTRLWPYTVVIPKPLVPLGDYPILEIIIQQLARAGFDRITLTVNHLAEIIQAFFGDGRKWGVSIDYSLEDQPLGTMGPLRLIPDLPEDFLIMNGDVLTDMDFGRFFDDHVHRGSAFTISSFVRTVKSEFGVLSLDSKSDVVGFKEKPETSHVVSMGIYMMNQRALTYLPPSGQYGFDQLVCEMINRRDYPNAQIYNGYWLDIGRPDDYAQAVKDFEDNKDKFIKP